MGKRLPRGAPFERLHGLREVNSLHDFLPKSARPFTPTEDHMRSILVARRARSEIFGEGLFADPAWDILLELYAANLGQRTIDLSELSRALELPSSIIRRWIAALEARGLLCLASAPTVEDGATCVLTTQAAERMERLAARWGSAFVSI